MQPASRVSRHSIRSITRGRSRTCSTGLISIDDDSNQRNERRLSGGRWGDASGLRGGGSFMRK